MTLEELSEKVVKLSLDHVRLKERIDSFITNELKHLGKDIAAIKLTVDTMANRGTRPTWSVVWLITGLFSLCTALLVALVR